MRRRVISRRLELSTLTRHWGLGTEHAVTDTGVANSLRSRVAVWLMHGSEVSKIVLTFSVRAVLNDFGFDVIDPLLNF